MDYENFMKETQTKFAGSELEFKVLKTLEERPFSSEELVEKLYTDNASPNALKSVRITIHRLKRKGVVVIRYVGREPYAGLKHKIRE